MILLLYYGIDQIGVTLVQVDVKDKNNVLGFQPSGCHE